MSIYYRLPLPVRRALNRARCFFGHVWVEGRAVQDVLDLTQRRKCSRCFKRQYRSAVALVYGVNRWHNVA